jgi:hypothetical protein
VAAKARKRHVGAAEMIANGRAKISARLREAAWKCLFHRHFCASARSRARATMRAAATMIETRGMCGERLTPHRLSLSGAREIRFFSVVL